MHSEITPGSQGSYGTPGIKPKVCPSLALCKANTLPLPTIVLWPQDIKVSVIFSYLHINDGDNRP